MDCTTLKTCIKCLNAPAYLCWWVKEKEEDEGICMPGRKVVGETFRQLSGGPKQWLKCPGLPPQAPHARTNAFDSFLDTSADSYPLFMTMFLLLVVAVLYLLYMGIIQLRNSYVVRNPPSPYRPQTPSPERRMAAMERALRRARLAVRDLLPENVNASQDSLDIRHEEVETMTMRQFIDTTAPSTSSSTAATASTSASTGTEQLIEVTLRRSTRVRRAPNVYPAPEFPNSSTNANNSTNSNS